MTEPIKLSTAIREGAKLRPQGHGNYFAPLGHSCALGAAFQAVTGRTGKDALPIAVDLDKLFPFLDNEVLHPAQSKSLSIAKIIVDLNDRLGWTREQIADWLEGIGY